MANVTAVFPLGTELEAAESMYWGQGDPVRLARFYITREELDEIRATLR
jgi:hypothetical protein